VVGGEAMDGLMITNQNGESINLGNEVPYFLQILEGASEVPVTIENQKAPKQDGSTYFDNTLGNRAITIEGMIVTKKNDVKEARRKMQRVLNPKLGEVKITYQGKEIRGIVENTPVFPSDEGNKGIYYQKYLINLLCHQPFWVEPFYESREMSYIMGGLNFKLIFPTSFSNRGFRRKAANDGDVSTPVEIEFKGPAINPTVTNETTREYLQVNRELSEKDVLTISTAFGEKYVRINGENAFHYIDLDSTFWQLMPGENILSYASNNDSVNTKVTVRWKNRYIGL
jgi:phage-related protein